MTRNIRTQADKLFAEGISPSRAQHRLRQNVPENAMPNLKIFQSRSRYFRFLHMLEHSKPSVMAKLVAESQYGPLIGNKKSFSFGYKLLDGAPVLGYGGATGVFKVGITTKKLLCRVPTDPSTFVFHWDATYKINSMAYPVLICGTTDPGGNFHPVAFFLIGKESTEEYEWAMKELMAVYLTVVGRAMKVDYVMADAALAPCSALRNLPDLQVKTILMCFYHCIACVKQRLSGVSQKVKSLVMRHLFKMHYARSRSEYELYWNEAQFVWGACDELVAKDFVRYFEAQWFRGDASNWQVYHTPEGFPTTNNPCELFNKHLKGIYTQRKTHGLCATFVMLGSIAEDYSNFKDVPFTSGEMCAVNGPLDRPLRCDKM
ncbi:hypothetical protein DYB32_009513 [Aphanomyces invadans]|uniref:MULE transposase domain-containing protein n=1 Tax=Aphanomyces invadans TaxID=157072 RepID=A0A3R6WF83_9STRA|nr:hypothetical protein DYB32_009513 [Aphanomyces invadans]